MNNEIKQIINKLPYQTFTLEQRIALANTKLC